MMSTPDAVKILNATTCVCGRPKQPGTATCRDCRLHIVPSHMLAPLVGARMGGAYELALDGVIRCIRERRKSARVVRAGRHSRGYGQVKPDAD